MISRASKAESCILSRQMGTYSLLSARAIQLMQLVLLADL